MYATAKEMFFPAFGEGFKETRKPAAKAATRTEVAAKDERTALIDAMCASWGTDLTMVRRYFEVSRAA